MGNQERNDREQCQGVRDNGEGSNGSGSTNLAKLKYCQNSITEAAMGDVGLSRMMEACWRRGCGRCDQNGRWAKAAVTVSVCMSITSPQIHGLFNNRAGSEAEWLHSRSLDAN